MSYPMMSARSTSGMARGAAVAAIVYYGLGLVVLELVLLVGGSMLTTLLQGAGNDEQLASVPSGALIGVVAVVLALIFAMPIALAVWMLVGARRGNRTHVLIPLVVFSVFSALQLLLVLSRQGSGSESGGALLLNLPWYVILLFGWIGWTRMGPAPRNAAYGNYPAQPYPPQYPQYPSTPYAGPQRAQPSGYPQATPPQPADPYAAEAAWQIPPQQTADSAQPQPSQSAGGPARSFPPEQGQADAEQSEPTRQLPPTEAPWPAAPEAWEPPAAPPESPGNTAQQERSPWARPVEPPDSQGRQS